MLSSDNALLISIIYNTTFIVSCVVAMLVYNIQKIDTLKCPKIRRKEQ